MLSIVGLSFLVLPPVLAATYGLLWPTVPSRTGLFITLGCLFGEIIAMATLFWVALPLAGVGISGARSHEQSETLWSLLGWRWLTGAILEVTVAYLMLVLLARWLQRRDGSADDRSA